MKRRDWTTVVERLGLALIGGAFVTYALREGWVSPRMIDGAVGAVVGLLIERMRWQLSPYLTNPKLNAAARSVRPPSPSLQDLDEQIRKEAQP